MPNTQSGIATVTRAGSGDGHEWLKVTLDPPYAAASGASSYRAFITISVANVDHAPTWRVYNRTPASFQIRFSEPFDGEVDWKTEER